MAFIIGREFADVQILGTKNETAPFLFNHMDILIKFGIENELDKK